MSPTRAAVTSPDPDREDAATSQTSARPVRKDVARNRAALLAAAEELVVTRGTDVTLDEIAQHANLNVATAYRHFANKREVLVALFQQRIDDVIALIHDLDEVADPLEALRTFFYTVGQWQQADRGLREAISANHGMEAIAEHRERLQPLAAHMIERARKSGQLRSDIAATDVPLILWITGAITTYSAEVRPELWRRYVDLLLDGMTATDTGRRLSTEALNFTELDQAMQAWGRRPSP